jgi:glyceraldehyde 3-phosphate dehydrogenase
LAAKVGINGFGRIGRLALRAILERHPEVEVVAINDLATPEQNAHLFKYDTNYGPYQGEISVANGGLVIDGRSIKVVSEREPAKLPWGDLGVELVIESTGRFTDAPKAAGHLEGGAKKVLISAPAKGEDITVVFGVNHEQYDPAQHNIVSNASCTTNALAPVAKVISDSFGIVNGLMTTVHSYTNEQQVLDQVFGDMRRARGAAMNITPTSTGAARAAALVIPELKGKFHGLALRVPTSTVSIIDLVVDTEQPVTSDSALEALSDAADGPLNGVLAVTHEPLVSTDFRGNPASSIVDAEMTMAIGDRMLKVLSWYDNEWGYSCRLADVTAYIIERGL